MPVGAGQQPDQQSLPSQLMNLTEAANFPGQLEKANETIDTIMEGAKDFTDAEKLAQPFVDAFDQFSSTAIEVVTQETRVAEDELRAFQNNNPDIRAASNLAISRKVKSEIFNAHMASSNAVFQELANNIFRATELASNNFTAISNVLAQSTTQLAGVTADFVASLTRDQVSIYEANLNHSADMARLSTDLEIAEIQAATARRGQDLSLEESKLNRQHDIDLFNLKEDALDTTRTTPQPVVPNISLPNTSADLGEPQPAQQRRLIRRFSPTGIPLASGVNNSGTLSSPYHIY